MSHWLHTLCDVGSASTALGKAKNYPGMVTEPLYVRYTPLGDVRPLCYAQPTELLRTSFTIHGYPGQVSPTSDSITNIIF